MATIYYYMEAQERKGPLDEAAFNSLVNDGVVTTETLVWYQGAPDWAPYGEIKRSADSGKGVDGDAVVCSECNKPFPKDDVIRFRGELVCAACKPLVMAKMSQGLSTSSAALDFAGFWIRLGAKLIDGIIISIPTYGAMYAAFGTLLPQDPDILTSGTYWGINLFSYLLGLLYGWLLTWKYGATWGKMAVGIKVVTADGGQIGVWRALARVPAEYVSAIVLGLGYLIAAFDAEKRTLHDYICSTRVVYK